MHLLGKMKEGLAFLPVCNQVHTVLVVLEAKGQARSVVVEKRISGEKRLLFMGHSTLIIKAK